MNVTDHYKRQFPWRDWQTILDALPRVDGQMVLDLGCGIGDKAAELVERGAHVVGVDMNEEVLQEARRRGLPRAEFHCADLRNLPQFNVRFDGIWSSFTAAYFPEFAPVLGHWTRYLRPGGWVALTEIDDFFGHEPIDVRTRELFDAYAREAVAAGRYDFHMGSKLHGYLEDAGFRVTRALTVQDKELSFDGPARGDVLECWRDRLNGMRLLRDFCGEKFGQVRDEFLDCMARADHRSTAKVYCCIGVPGDRS